MNVERVRVGEILRLERIPVQPDPTVEYVSIGVRSFGKGIFHYEPKLGSQLGSLRFFEVQPDRLVVSNIKGWEGAIALSSTSDAGCLASNRFLTYVPIDGRIDVGWARWYFLSDAGISLIQRASPGSADRNRTLAIERFEALEIPLPSIDEQRRVAHQLDTVSTSAAELKECRLQAEAIRQALMESRIDGYLSEIEAPMFPIEDLGEVRGGIQKHSGRVPGANPVRYLTVAHVGRDEISLEDARYFEVSQEEMSRRVLQCGDVLIIEGNGSTEQIGRAALFPGADEPFVHQNHVIRVRPFTEVIDPDFLNLYLNSPAGRCAVRAQARTSSGLQSLSVGRIKQILVPVPSIEEQCERTTAIRRIQGEETRLTDMMRRSSRLAQAVLPAALNEAFAGLR